MEVENGGKEAGAVEWVLKEDFIANSNVTNLIGWDVGIDNGLRRIDGGVV